MQYKTIAKSYTKEAFQNASIVRVTFGKNFPCHFVYQVSAAEHIAKAANNLAG